MVSQLVFQKAKDAEVAWFDAEIVVRNKQIEPTINDMEIGLEDEKHILTLEPLSSDNINAHNSVFINELKLSDFKQVLMRHNINSEFSGGVLWCCNGTLALRRIDTGKVTIEGCLSEEYYKIRELLYEQYAIV